MWNGTASAVEDHHFVTCAHIIKNFADNGAEDVLIDQRGPLMDSRTFLADYDHVAFPLFQNFALLTRQLHNLPVRTSVRPAEHEVLEP